MATASALRRSACIASSNIIWAAESTSATSQGESLRMAATRAACWIQQTCSYTAPSPRMYSTAVVDKAHRGLVLPYPTEAPLDTSVFEDETQHPDYDLAASLPNLVRDKNYHAAASARLRLIEQRIQVPQDIIYEKMAMRMLDPAANPYGKVRVNSFLVWWAMIPDWRDLRSTSFEPSTSTARANNINRILDTLMHNTHDLQPLMRFAILATRKGYSNFVYQRTMTHVVRWALPAVSAKFLQDLCTAAAHDLGASHPDYLRIRRQWYEMAIWGHFWSKRFKEAKLLFREHLNDPGQLPFSNEFCAQVLSKILKLGEKGRFDQWSEWIRTAYPSYDLLLWSEPAVVPVASRKKSTSLAGELKFFKRNVVLRQLPPARQLAAFMHAYHTQRPNGKALHLLHHRLANRHETYQHSKARRWKAHGTQMGYWATAEMIYHLRHQKDPTAALHVFTTYYKTMNLIPSDLANTIGELIGRRLSSGTLPTIGLGGQPLGIPASDRIWPSTMTLPVYWEAVIASHKTLGISLNAAYDLFLRSLDHHLRTVDPHNTNHDSPTITELRKVHSLYPTPTSTPHRQRFNINSTTRAPVYQPDAVTFNLFLHAAVIRDKIASPENKCRLAFKMFDDMAAHAVTPNTTSWSLLANAASRAGEWHQVLLLIRKLREEGLIGTGWSSDAGLIHSIEAGNDVVLTEEKPGPSHTRTKPEGARNGMGTQMEVIYGGIVRGLTESRLFREARKVQKLLLLDGYVSGSNQTLDQVLDILDNREQKQTQQAMSS